MKTKNRTFLCVLSLALVMQARGQGSLEAIQSTTQWGVGYVPDGVSGWAFTPSVNVAVTSLGLLTFDPRFDEVAELGLWDSGGNLLASVVTSPGNPIINFT